MDGILIVNKPKGYTSHDVVNKLRKILNIKQIGHCGTLDPNATGVLPILIGQATKLSKYLIEHDKTYIATLKLGEKRDTADSEGKVVKTDNKINNIKENQIIEVLKSFIGKQKQIPPLYSSIKINGKKAYEYAREGKEIKLEARDIEIYETTFIKYENEEITFKVKCSKGTYIRSLCEDIAEELGTIGYMKELQRIQVDKFKIEQAYTIEQLEENFNNIKLITIEENLETNKKINLSSIELKLFLNGVQITRIEENGIYKIYNENIFIGLGIIKNNLLKRDVIIV